MSFASVSYSPSEISKVFRPSVKQLPRLLWPPPPMHITTIYETTLQQGSWEAVELLAEKETREQETASLNDPLHALTSGHGQSIRTR